MFGSVCRFGHKTEAGEWVGLFFLVGAPSIPARFAHANCSRGKRERGSFSLSVVLLHSGGSAPNQSSSSLYPPRVSGDHGAIGSGSLGDKR